MVENEDLRTRNDLLEARNKLLERKVLSLEQRLFGKKKDQIKARFPVLRIVGGSDEESKKKAGRKRIGELYSR